MAASAAQMASYFYPEEQDPEGAFSWWLSPCGGTELVPDEIKKLFGILSQVADGVTSFVKPKGDKGKHTGKKGDDGNPINPRGPKAGTGKGPNGLQTTKQKGCKVAPAKQKYRPAPHVIREQRCVGGKSGTTTVTETFVSTITYQANATPMKVTKTCDAQHTQACYHYSSAIRNNPSWETLICPKEAAATKKPKLGRKAVATYDAQHAKRWTEWDPTLASGRTHDDCERDEYPPVYLLNAASPAYTNIGQPGGQLIRFLPDGENGGAASKWRSVCFNPLFQDMSDAEYARKFIKGPPPPPTGKPPPAPKPNQIIKNVEQHHGHMFSDKRPEFSFTGWGHSNRAPLKDDGLWDNPCWPKNWAVNDPGFALYTHDPWYTSNGRQPFANYAV